MRPLEGRLTIPAGDVAKLEPGGNHMMLERVKRPLVPGDKILITFHFERGGHRLVQAEIRNAPLPSSSGHEGH
jgi:hypothetical protein